MALERSGRDWEDALERWRRAGLIGEDAALAIREWEAERAPPPQSGPLEAVLSYLGASIMLAGAIMLTILASDGAGLGLVLPFAFGLVSGGAAWRASRWSLRWLADGFAASAVVMTTIGWGLTLDELASDGSEAVGVLVICVWVIVAGGAMTRVVRSPLALTLATFAATFMPLTIAMHGDPPDVGIYGSGRASMDGVLLWASLAACAIVGVAAQGVLSQREGLAVWGRLGASLGSAAALLGLSWASGDPTLDWAAMLAAWIMTAWAFRAQRVELLPASGLLLMGAAAGGLSDIQDEWRVALTITILLSALQFAVLGASRERLLGVVAEHWLFPVWQAMLLGASVAATIILAADSEALAPIGIVWALGLVASGAVRQRRVELAFGLIGVYAAGLSLILGPLDSSVGAVVGTLVFGLLLSAATIVWRRRARLTLAEPRS